jgi:putative membrane protein
VNPIGKYGAALAISLAAIGQAHADPAAPPAGTLDDRQIAQRVVDLTRSQEQTSEAVKGRLASPPAWNLAERMEVDHAALEREFAPLAGTALNSTSNPVAASQGDIAALSKLSGDDLEKAYVDGEVKAHQAMLGTIDSQLLPGAQSDELRRRLVALRAEVSAHLDHAQRVQYAEWVRQTEAEERNAISREIGNSEP